MSTYKKIHLLDSTLREGEQALGMCFSVHEKIALCKKLREFGVDVIEIGHPGISAAEEQLCSQIRAHITDIELLVHARACTADIIAAKNTNAAWVGVWTSYNDISLTTKFTNKSRAWIQQQTQSAIILAKKLGLKVRFTIEDASRTDLTLIDELARVAITAGADRISLADTVGHWHPKECYTTVHYAATHFNCDIEVHLHNDLGLAQANAIAAIDAGASIIDVSVLGIGERAGICDLFALGAVLEKFYGAAKYQWQLSQELSQFIARIGAFRCMPHQPIVGRHVFTHVSQYHIKAALTDPAVYESLDPTRFGSQRRIALNNLERGNQQRYLNTLQVKTPFIKGASELRYHRDGSGKRWVLMDNRIDERSPVYLIERVFDKDYSDEYQPHVDVHAHHCDSFFVFMGDNHDGTGLTVRVTFGCGRDEVTELFASPASVFIPAGVVHSYQYISGTGRFLNVVLAPSYNESLIDDNASTPRIPTGSMTV